MHSITAYFNSIHWKIQLWYGVLLFSIISAFLTFGINSEIRISKQKVDADLTHYVPFLANIIYNELEYESLRDYYHSLTQDPENKEPIRVVTRWQLIARKEGYLTSPDSVVSLENFRPRITRINEEVIDELLRNDMYAVLYNIDRSIRLKTENAPENIPAPRPSPDKPESVAYARDRAGYRELERKINYGYAIVIGVKKSLNPHFIDLQSTILRYIVYAVSFFILAFFGGGWIISRALKPINSISRQVEKISLGHLSERIDVPAPDSEIKPLVSSLNSTFQRLEQSFEQQRLLVADASHELRTPLTVLSTQVQLGLNDLDTVDEYRSVMQSCQTAISRMTNLVEGMLTLARIDSQVQDNAFTEFNIEPLIMETVEVLRSLADENGVTVEVRLTDAKIKGTVGGFTSIISNLLSNAIYYNKENGKINITSYKENQFVEIRVSDSGAGIPDHDQKHVFERFYRVDKSRNRRSGFAGLGLSIVKETVESFGGAITLKSELDVGTEFRVRLPVANSGS